MHTQCTTRKHSFKGLGERRVEAEFTAERITTDTGGLLVREVAEKMDLFEKATDCFVDYRDPDRREHDIDQLLAQRIMGLIQGYEDLNDHDELRSDPTWATLVGKEEDPAGQKRTQEADQGKPLASKATLGRLEHAPWAVEETDRYHRIAVEVDQIADLFVELFVEDLDKPDEPIILDLDATHDPLHGKRESQIPKRDGFSTGSTTATATFRCTSFARRSFFARSSGGQTDTSVNIDPSAGCLPEIKRIVEAVREKWPDADIILRADSGFARERIMRWCEETGVDYVFGLAKNSRLTERIDGLMARVEEEAEEAGQPVRRFEELRYSTLDSWSRRRRVVAKAEQGNLGLP